VSHFLKCRTHNFDTTDTSGLAVFASTRTFGHEPHTFGPEVFLVEGGITRPSPALPGHRVRWARTPRSRSRKPAYPRPGGRGARAGHRGGRGGWGQDGWGPRRRRQIDTDFPRGRPASPHYNRSSQTASATRISERDR